MASAAGNSSTTTSSSSTNSTNLVWPGIPLHPARSLQPDIIACSVLTLLISSVFVGLRFYTRGRVNHVLNASDWCILPALVSSPERGVGLHEMVVLTGCVLALRCGSHRELARAYVLPTPEDGVEPPSTETDMASEMAHGAGRHVWENDPYSLPGFERVSPSRLGWLASSVSPHQVHVQRH